MSEAFEKFLSQKELLAEESLTQWISIATASPDEEARKDRMTRWQIQKAYTIVESLSETGRDRLLHLLRMKRPDLDTSPITIVSRRLADADDALAAESAMAIVQHGPDPHLLEALEGRKPTQLTEADRARLELVLHICEELREDLAFVLKHMRDS